MNTEGAPADLPPGEASVPVRRGQPGGEAAPMDDINPLAPNVDGKNYEMNPARAETMAYAEDDFRTKAVQNRDAERDSREVTEGLAELENIHEQVENSPGILKMRERRRLAKKHETRRRELGDVMQADMERRDGLQLTTSKQFFNEDLPGSRREPNSIHPYVFPETRAKFYDRQAARIGEWAGLLHDKPLSDEFKEAHPGLQFQPKSLVRMENEVEVLEQRIKQPEKTPYRETEVSVSTAIKGPNREGRPPETQRLLVWAADEEMDNEYEKITGELLEGAKALDALHTRLVDEVDIQPLRDRLAMTRNVLNDVRRAVGLPVEGGEAEAAPEAQPPDTGSQAGTQAK